jgi:predicted RNase H-like HicB family nuclease
MDYIAIIHKDADSDFGVSFPDFPGCITAGRTLEEAKDMALEALTGHIEVMREAGERIPEPSPLDEVMRNPDFQDGVGFLVSIKEPGKTVRVNITLSEGELEQIDQRARAQGLSRSAFLVQSGLRALVIALLLAAAAPCVLAAEFFDWERCHARQDA